MTAKKMSVREAEQLVKRLKSSITTSASKKGGREKSRDVLRIEEELSDLLTTTVQVLIKKSVKRHGKTQEMGDIVIQFSSLDELNGLIDKLRVSGGN